VGLACEVEDGRRRAEGEDARGEAGQPGRDGDRRERGGRDAAREEHRDAVAEPLGERARGQVEQDLADRDERRDEPRDGEARAAAGRGDGDDGEHRADAGLQQERRDERAEDDAAQGEERGGAATGRGHRTSATTSAGAGAASGSTVGAAAAGSTTGAAAASGRATSTPRQAGASARSSRSWGAAEAPLSQRPVTTETTQLGAPPSGSASVTRRSACGLAATCRGTSAMPRPRSTSSRSVCTSLTEQRTRRWTPCAAHVASFTGRAPHDGSKSTNSWPERSDQSTRPRAASGCSGAHTSTRGSLPRTVCASDPKWSVVATNATSRSPSRTRARRSCEPAWANWISTWG